MAGNLRASKATITKLCNKLEKMLKEEPGTAIVAKIETETAKDHINRCEDAVRAIENQINKIETARKDYIEVFDSLENKAADEEKDFDDYIERTNSINEEATDHLNLLKAQIISYEKASKTEGSCISPAVANLPPIPIPKFSGEMWEWEAFWGAFDHTVHSRDMDDYLKMNYLLDSLEGKARTFVKQYEISRDSYQLVIHHLKNKYGNSKALIDQLLQRLHTIGARSERLQDQEILCESLFSIVNQLRRKGELVDSMYLQQQLLRKFSRNVQRHALDRISQVDAEERCTTNELLNIISQYISKELKLETQMNQNFRKEFKATPTEHQQFYANSPKPSIDRTFPPCFYCETIGHAPNDCQKLRTPEERIRFMKMSNLCHNCGSRYHQTSYCKGGSCKICKKFGHHTSACKEQSSAKEQHRFLAESEQGPLEEKPSKQDKGSNIKTKNSKQAISNAKEKTTAPTNTKAAIADATQYRNNTIVYTKKEETRGVQILAGQAKVLNSNGKEEVVEVILDTASDRSYISNDLADRLQLQDNGCVELVIHAFDSKPNKKECGVTKIKLQDSYGDTHEFTVTRIEKIAGPLKRYDLSRKDRNFIRHHNIKLSIDPDTGIITPQLLLGCVDSFTLLDDKLTSNKTLPSGIKLIASKLGYLVTEGSGTLQNISDDETETMDERTQVLYNEATQKSWEELLTFESSEVHEFTGSNKEEREQQDMAIWQHFEKTIERREDGYYVRLPWKNDEAQRLPNNKGMAVKRLQATLASLKDNPTVLSKYHDTIEDQLERNIIEEVDESQATNGAIVHYLPHQAVLTPKKETTKLRIVYDASAHPKKAPSLNDVLHQGPSLLPQICDIMLRFRIGDIAIISDVEKAFLQVRLHEQDRDATRFLWIRDVTRPYDSENLAVYRFTRVTFGLNCSPFLLAGTIKYHLNNYVDNSKLSRDLMDNTYVDNVIITASSTQEAIQKYKESKEIFNDMNMNLRGFLSNDEQLMEEIPQKDISSNTTPKVLGITWCSREDKLLLSCRYMEVQKLTKRKVAEQVAAVYDPMGWLTPLTLPGKLFLQTLWHHGYAWDKKISEEHAKQWQTIAQNFNGFTTSIPRAIAQLGSDTKLFVFADASKECMAACAYLACNDESHLLEAKSKLQSRKQKATIPKLELNALTMAVRLAHSIYTALNKHTSITQITVLSDSEVALAWIRSSKAEKTAGVLIKNRVKEIRRINKSLGHCLQFAHVATNENPADCATRGLNKVELMDHYWWRGPAFIREPVLPENIKTFTLPQEAEENQDFTIMTISNQPNLELLEWTRHTKLETAQQAVAYALRFIRGITAKVRPELRERIHRTIPEIKSTRTEPYITAKEYEMALQVIIRIHQKDIINSMPKGIRNPLNLFQDKNGIWRCKGRLNRASIPKEQKQPILIRPGTRLAEIIVTDAHLPYHTSTSQTIANVRKRFWIPTLRRIARKTIRRCVACQKMNNLPYKYPTMEDLPETRVRRSRPFEHVGIDYFGPISAKEDESIIKAYGIIITCASTRLIHLELVQNMSTNSLLLALRRFFARRGVPKSITSDNAPNFSLAEEILHTAAPGIPLGDDTLLEKTMAKQGVTWRTITPYAPWQGAFYERLIKSVKHSLYKVMQKSLPTVEQLQTFLVEVEGTLNTRPLTYLEEEPDDLVILRPIDFIQQDMVITYPFEGDEQEEEDGTYIPPKEQNMLRTAQEVRQALRSSQKLTEQYWTIWSRQYLVNLRETHKLNIDKRRGTSAIPVEGTVVLIHDPIQPRNTWKIGRISKLKQSKSGAIREAEVMLPNRRIIRRPINLLIPLEIGETTKQQAESKADQLRVEDTERFEEEHQHRYNLRPRKHGQTTTEDNGTP